MNDANGCRIDVNGCGCGIIIFIFIVLIGWFVVMGWLFCDSGKSEHEQLVNDYMAEYKIDRPTAERRIRIDRNTKRDGHSVIYAPVNVGK